MHETGDSQRAAVLAANEAFYRAFNERSLEAMDRVWGRREPIVCIHPGWNMIVGRAEVMESWRAILGNEAQPRVVSGGAVAILHGDVAIVPCREFVGGTPLVVTNVFLREGGVWRMVHHHSGPVFRP